MPIDNPFDSLNVNDSTRPALGLVAITTSDSADQARVLRTIYCGVAGNIAVMDTEGNSVTHLNVASGSYIGPFSVKRVLATGTTATNLIGYV